MTEMSSDMSKAPTDGTPILLYGEIRAEIRFDDRANSKVDIVIGRKIQGTPDVKPDEGFEWEVLGGVFYKVWVKPTHWAPLPKKPVTETSA